MKLACSNCDSENVQKITGIHSSGTVTSHAQTAGNFSGISVSGDNVGVVSGSTSNFTRNTTQSSLASRFSPPIARSESWFLKSLIPAIAVGIGFLYVFSHLIKAVLGTGTLSGIIWVASFFAGIVLTVKFFMSKAKENKEYNRTVYAQQLRDWQQSYYCHKCDSVFIPSSKM